MATNISFTVLLPDGRRHIFKASPNFTIMQILEGVCQKRGFKAEEYDLKHHNKILDTCVIIRFSGLPNNAQLEMVPCTKVRQSSKVTVGIQFEDGSRKIGEFPSETTMIDILKQLASNVNLETSILVYMHRKMFGEDVLKTTTLKSLGLNAGRAILRLMNRDPEELNYQAHIYKPPPRSVKPDEDNVEPPKAAPCYKDEKKRQLDPINIIREEKLANNVSAKTAININKKSEPMDCKVVEDKGKSLPMEVDETFVEPKLKERKLSSENEEKNKEENKEETKEDKEIKVQYLGERNALIFNKADAKALVMDEIPDSFFELTINDAKRLLNDVKKTRESLEECPLMTAAQRQLEHDKAILNNLHKYKTSVIRIHFPDQLVLQGIFFPVETVQTIKDFVNKFLTDPESPFDLYVTPPRRELNPESRLIDENLVPSAILHYCGTSELKSELKSNLCDPAAAALEACKSRIKGNREFKDTKIINVSSESSTIIDKDSTKNDISDAVPGTSGESKQKLTRSDQVPKWFKAGLK